MRFSDIFKTVRTYAGIPVAEFTGGVVIQQGPFWTAVQGFAAVAAGAGETKTPDQSIANTFFLIVTGANDFTIAAPTNASYLTSLTVIDLTFIIYNNSGGAMGVITWNAAYHLGGAFTNPASTKVRQITFTQVNTALYYEKSRLAADVAGA